MFLKLSHGVLVNEEEEVNSELRPTSISQVRWQLSLPGRLAFLEANPARSQAQLLSLALSSIRGPVNSKVSQFGFPATFLPCFLLQAHRGPTSRVPLPHGHL